MNNVTISLERYNALLGILNASKRTVACPNVETSITQIEWLSISIKELEEVERIERAIIQ